MCGNSLWFRQVLLLIAVCSAVVLVPPSVACAEEGAPAEAMVWLRGVPASSPTVDPPDYDSREYASYQMTQAVLLETWHVLQPALDSRGVEGLDCLQDIENKIEWLAEHLTVSFPDDGQIMLMQFGGATTEENLEILRAIVNSYLENVVASGNQEDFARLQYLRSKYVELERECLELRRLLIEAEAEADAEEADSYAAAERAQMEFEIELQETAMAEVRRSLDRLEMQLQQPPRAELLYRARTTE